MLRQQKRQLARQEAKEETQIKTRTYTYDECVRIAHTLIKDVEAQYSVKYALCLAAALNAEPTSFGRKRVCRTMKLFFDQVDAIDSGLLTLDEVKEVAKKVGVITGEEDNAYTVTIDERSKKDKHLVMKEIIIGGDKNGRTVT